MIFRIQKQFGKFRKKGSGSHLRYSLGGGFLKYHKCFLYLAQGSWRVGRKKKGTLVCVKRHTPPMLLVSNFCCQKKKTSPWRLLLRRETSILCLCCYTTLEGGGHGLRPSPRLAMIVWSRSQTRAGSDMFLDSTTKRKRWPAQGVESTVSPTWMALWRPQASGVPCQQGGCEYRY